MQMRAAEMAAESGWSAAAVAEAVAEEEHAVAVADAMVSDAGWTAADAAEVAAEAEQSAAAAAAAECDEAFRRWLSEGGHTPLDSPVAWAATRPAVGKGIDDLKGKVDDVECKGKGKGKGIHEAAAA
jgi:hypothetical protein